MVGALLWRHILGSPLLFAYVLPMIVLYLSVPLFGFNLVGAPIAYWELWGLIVTAVLVIVNHVWMGFDAEGRGWHDWLLPGRWLSGYGRMLSERGLR